MDRMPPTRARRAAARRLAALCFAGSLIALPAGIRGASVEANGPEPRPDAPADPGGATGDAEGEPESPARAAPEASAQGDVSAEDAALFEERIRPLLERNCHRCHGGRRRVRGGLHLTSRAGVLRGGDLGPAVDLEDPESSPLLEAVRYTNDDLQMPPTGKLSAKEISLLERWIRAGLPWTGEGAEAPVEGEGEGEGDGLVVTDADREFWSFQPLERPEPPEVEDEAWVRNPIDAFVLHRLEEAWLEPAPLAGRAALLRRATYDLTGLPPTPGELEAFLADESPRAWERVVDRLLRSPRFGERWGRHWLDVVRFAETNSFERDSVKPFAWRYRDYVIESFNEDKPYDRFVLEQLAGDELDQPTPESITATGFYRLGPWDDEPTDKLQARYDELDDVVTTTSQAFLGLTVNCARCHDHKLDPIPQTDYYSFLAFFHNVRPTQRGNKGSILTPIPGPQDLAARERELEELEEARTRVRDEVGELERKVLEGVPEDALKAASAGGGVDREELLESRIPKVLSRDEQARYRELREELTALEKREPEPFPKALSVTESGPDAPPTHVLIRGNAHAKGDLVEPAFLTVLGGERAEAEPREDSCGRRRALAEWIASPRNPLTARVFANRIWQRLFGRGIVRTPNNFGSVGERPTHPALLDWLAAELIAGDWRPKALIRTILLSNAYRMSSRGDEKALEIDARNDLFWRQNMRRLAAEEIRDSLLAVNGTLNLDMGGPGIYPVIPETVLQGQSRPGKGWGKSSPAERARRSVYIHLKRSLIVPLLDVFDFADTDASCPERFTTTQPTQALTLLNSAFLQEQAARFAGRLQREAGPDRRAQVELGFRLALARRPTEDDVADGLELIKTLETEEGLSSERALHGFCLMIYNLNEFLYLD